MVPSFHEGERCDCASEVACLACLIVAEANRSLCEWGSDLVGGLIGTRHAG